MDLPQLLGPTVMNWRSALAARQLASQFLELRVGGQAARGCVRVDVRCRAVGRRLRGRRAGGCRRRRARRSRAFLGARGCFGLLCLDNLALVSLEARPCFGVLTLPLGLLLFVAWQPLVGLGVEALGVDVVALSVVVRRHAVERRVEVAVGDSTVAAALVGLLQRQADTPALEV